MFERKLATSAINVQIKVTTAPTSKAHCNPKSQRCELRKQLVIYTERDLLDLPNEEKPAVNLAEICFSHRNRALALPEFACVAARATVRLSCSHLKGYVCCRPMHCDRLREHLEQLRGGALRDAVREVED